MYVLATDTGYFTDDYWSAVCHSYTSVEYDRDIFPSV